VSDPFNTGLIHLELENGGPMSSEVFVVWPRTHDRVLTVASFGFNFGFNQQE
jgi:hypothetical protein